MNDTMHIYTSATASARQRVKCVSAVLLEDRTSTLAPYEAMAGRSMSRWASTEATSAARLAASSCCTPLSCAPKAPCVVGMQLSPSDLFGGSHRHRPSLLCDGAFHRHTLHRRRPGLAL